MRGALHLWDLTSGTLKAMIPRLEGARNFAWSPDSKVLAVPGTAGVSLWDPGGQGRIRECRSGERAEVVAWSPDGRAAYCGTSSAGISSHDQSAFSVSTNDSFTWNQTGLIDL